MNFLYKLKLFFRQHGLWLGLIAVALPLLINLGLQYNALKVLQKTMPAARTVYMRRFLAETSTKVAQLYKEQAGQVLNVPASAFLYRYPEPDELRKRQTAWTRTLNPRQFLNYNEIGDYFRTHPFKGARLLFVGIVAGPGDPTYSFIDFYDPHACAFRGHVGRSEFSAAHAARFASPPALCPVLAAQLMQHPGKLFYARGKSAHLTMSAAREAVHPCWARSRKC